MKTQEPQLIRYIYYIALITLSLYFIKMSWISFRTIQLAGADLQNISHFGITALLYLLGAIVVFYRFLSLRKNGFRSCNIQTPWLRNIGGFLILVGTLFTVSGESIFILSYITDTRNFMQFLIYFINSKEILILGVCMYELSRITAFEIEDSKAG